VFTAATTRYDSMSYRRCGSSGLLLPAISLGLWHNFGGVDNFENGRAMLRRAFDLASHTLTCQQLRAPYGSAETNFGRLFAKISLPTAMS